METSAEACWRLSKACGQWAVESRDSAARIAFRQMATEWARLAFNEEFRSPVGEQIDPPTSENSEVTPVEILASSLLTPSSENTQPEVQRDWTRPQLVAVLGRSICKRRCAHTSERLLGDPKSASHCAHNVQSRQRFFRLQGPARSHKRRADENPVLAKCIRRRR